MLRISLVLHAVGQLQHTIDEAADVGAGDEEDAAVGGLAGDYSQGLGDVGDGGSGPSEDGPSGLRGATRHENDCGFR